MSAAVTSKKPITGLEQVAAQTLRKRTRRDDTDEKIQASVVIEGPQASPAQKYRAVSEEAIPCALPKPLLEKIWMGCSGREEEQNKVEQQLAQVQQKLKEIRNQKTHLQKEEHQCEKEEQTLKSRLLKLQGENKDIQTFYSSVPPASRPAKRSRAEISQETKQNALQENALLVKLFQDVDVYYQGIKVRIIGQDVELNQFLLSPRQEVPGNHPLAQPSPKASREELSYCPEKDKNYLIKDITMDYNQGYYEAKILKIKKKPTQEDNDVHCLILWVGLKQRYTRVLTDLGSILPFGPNDPKVQDLKKGLVQMGDLKYPAYLLN